MANAWGWPSKTCDPRRSGSSGVARVKPSGARSARHRSIRYPVSASEAARSVSIPASASIVTPGSISASETTGAVPVRKRRIPAAGR